MLNETQEYILDIAETLLIELAYDHLISTEELTLKVGEIMKLVPLKSHRECLIYKFELRHVESGEYTNYYQILKEMKKV